MLGETSQDQPLHVVLTPWELGEQGGRVVNRSWEASSDWKGWPPWWPAGGRIQQLLLLSFHLLLATPFSQKHSGTRGQEGSGWKKVDRRPCKAEDGPHQVNRESICSMQSHTFCRVVSSDVSLATEHFDTFPWEEIRESILMWTSNLSHRM